MSTPLFRVPRISPDPLLNNIYLTVTVVTCLALATTLLVWILSALVRRVGKASGIAWIERFGERSRKTFRILGTLLVLVQVLVGCSAIAFAVLRGVDLQTWVSESGLITPEIGRRAATIAAVLVSVLILAAYLRWLLHTLLPRLEERLRRIEAFAGQEENVKRFVSQLEPMGSNAVVYIAFSLASRWLDIAGSAEWFIKTILYVLVVVSGARAAITLVHLITESLDRLGTLKLEKTRFGGYYVGVRRILPLGKRVFEAIAYLAAATLIVQRVEALEEFAPYGPRIMKLLGIFFGARVVVELSRVLVSDAMTRGLADLDEAKKKRITLVYLVQSIVKYTIYFFTGLTMMRELGLDPTPILAGAGIVGLAVGLGAQKLVNDVVSGFFILFEAQILAGDYIKVGDADGIVEDVQLRVTIVRDDRGRVHVLRNGDIGTVINYSRGYIHAVVDMPIAYEADMREITEIAEEAGKILKEQHPKVVLGDPAAKLQNFQESSMLLRVEVKVAPGYHDELEPVLRGILAELFRARGVDVPYPRRIQLAAPSSGSARRPPSGSRAAQAD